MQTTAVIDPVSSSLHRIVIMVKHFPIGSSWLPHTSSWALVLGGIEPGFRLRIRNQNWHGLDMEAPLTVRYGLGLGRAGRDRGDSKELEVPVYLAHAPAASARGHSKLYKYLLL